MPPVASVALSSAVEGSSSTANGAFRPLQNDRQQQVGRVLCIAVDLVGHGFANADVVRDVFHAAHRAGTGRAIHAGDIQADAMSGLEFVGCRQDLDLVLYDLT